MKFTMRQARAEDSSQMLQLYNRFTQKFVGSASRTIKPFRKMLRKKDNITFVVLGNRNRIMGYAYARFEKRFNRGEFREIVVDPEHDVELIAQQLAERVNAAFMRKKVSSITAGSVRNPVYEKVFRKLGFFESESNGVFMYGILNVSKFLKEIAPVFVNRLRQLKKWNGLVQIECEDHSLFLQKASEKVESIVWTNEPVSLKTMVSRELLIRLIFGLADPMESYKSGQLRLETSVDSGKANRLLGALFPKTQFLIMDYW